MLFGLCVVCTSSGSARADAVFAFRPVGATTGHALNGNEITIFDVPSRVTLELRVSGWDPDRNGVPVVCLYQATINSAGYTSGSTGALSPALLPCDDNGDCFATSNCLPSGLCDSDGSIYGDITHPDYIFWGFDSFTVQDTSTPDYRIIGLILTSGVGVPDPGVDRYIGTLMLDVSANATGTFTVGLIQDVNRTFLADENYVVIPPSSFLPARITIVHDCNQNGVPDNQDIASGTSTDCNANGRPDECEADCNANGVADGCDISAGTSDDCNTNGIPDECEPDCNNNGIADECETGGTTTDCNFNNVPDVCEVGWDQDCNLNSVPDLCDLFAGADSDCNGNAVPDGCDISSGTSGDCDANGQPDECQRDCNRNGRTDACDILNGSSVDLNADGVPDECYRGVALKPVGATVPHRIHRNEITILMGGGRVTLELQIAGWDPNLDGLAKLGMYMAEIDSASFAGVLSIGGLPCATNDDCYLSAACLPRGVCTATTAAYIESFHPNFVFSGNQPITLVSFADPDVDYSAFLAGSGTGVVDPGQAAYGGTLILDVPPSATGTYTIGFTADTALLNEFDQAIPGVDDRVPAVIRINEDCNGNGVRDDIDIANGTLTDADGDGAPDECEFGVPGVEPMGSRYIRVTPQGGGGPVALRVTSEQFPCLERYVRLQGAGIGRLSDTPQFLTPAQWGTVSIADAEVISGATYSLMAELAGGGLGLAASGSTMGWGDVGPPWGNVDFRDVSGTVDRFKAVSTAPPVARTDFYPAVPDGVIDFRDISATVDAFKGYGYPFGVPCP
jgi:hypothetical protein